MNPAYTNGFLSMKKWICIFLFAGVSMCAAEEGTPYAGMAAMPTGDNKLIVTEVAHRGPADRAGINQGDYVLQIDGKRIQNRQELKAVFAGSRVGQQLELTLQRKDYTITRTLIMGNRMMPQPVFRPSERHLGEERIDSIIHRQYLIAAELTQEKPNTESIRQYFKQISELNPEHTYATPCYLIFWGKHSNLILVGNENTLVLTEDFHDKSRPDEKYRLMGRGAVQNLPPTLRVRIRCHLETLPSFLHISRH